MKPVNALPDFVTPDQGCMVLCMTPLHVLTAAAIANKTGVRFSQGIYVTSSEDEKNKSYAQRMSAFCESTHFKVVPSDANLGGLKHLTITLRRRRFLRWLRELGAHSSCLIPSSLSHYVYAVATVFGRTIYTYDDGILNIHPGPSILERDAGIPARALLRVSGIRHYPRKIARDSVRHYTIYEGKNAYSRTLKVALFTQDESRPGGNSVANNEKLQRILLGPAPEASSYIIEHLRNASARIGFDRLLPHPRWKDFSLDGVATIETPLIAEDYVLRELSSDMTARVDLYGLESSALINLAGCQRARSVCLLPHDDSHRAMRELMSTSGVHLQEVQS